jgi:N-acetylglucosaminyldiphosphoundecaprenol N-acetyl-beta-D-mannosaminyltransferase
VSTPARILDMPVSLDSHEQVLNSVAERIRARLHGGHISITNTETMYHARRSPDLLKFVQTAQHSLCDGVGVVAAGWFWGERIRRYTGPNFQLDCTQRGVTEGWRHFYYGGKEGVAVEMARRFAEKYPGSICVGTYAPPFRPLTDDEDRAVIEMINAAKPDIVWVGLGLPKQERWIADHLGKIQASWMVGVGAAFDYHSGEVPWAPPVMRALGMEWIFRLVREPRLRGIRYWHAFLFVLEAAWKGVLRFLPARPQSETAGL